MTTGPTDEAEFHDEWASSVDPRDIDVTAAHVGLGCPEVAWIDGQLGDLTSLRVLDLGSGLGEGAIWFAKQGANVTACDISPGMLGVVERLAHHEGVSVRTQVGSATDLSMFDDSTFDVVYGANLLHHVDVSLCLREAHRVLKFGGRAAFWDPLKYNPVINQYRRMSEDLHTVDEHPLGRGDLRTMRSVFGEVTVRTFWLTGLLIFIRFFALDRLDPGRVRYWKVVIDRQLRHRRFLSAAHALDRWIFRLVPPARWLGWNMAVVCTKTTADPEHMG